MRSLAMKLKARPKSPYNKISRRAAQLWEEAKRPKDKDKELWFEAKKQVVAQDAVYRLAYR